MEGTKKKRAEKGKEVEEGHQKKEVNINN